MEETWKPAEYMTPLQAMAAGIPREVIEEAWRETDRMLGTSVADRLIADHFGSLS